jgi:crotonobetainyl-CoA:carnitine CoA-transferase CaiB-like acyl-CoA transferase
MERAGLSEAAIRERNPRVVYAVISAFAADGPDATRAGIDVVFQAESGMISISGEERGPVSKTATTVGDYLAGTNTALAVCAALVERASTGIGRRVDVSLRDGLMAIQGGWNAIAFATGEQPSRRGTASPYLAPNQVFDASDGQIAIAVVSERHWRLLCDALRRPDLVDRFPTNDERMARLDDLVAELQAVIQKERADHWVQVLDDAGLPVGHVRTLLGAFEAAPHMRLDLGTMPVTGSPIRIDRHRLGHTSRAASLGE